MFDFMQKWLFNIGFNEKSPLLMIAITIKNTN